MSLENEQANLIAAMREYQNSIQGVSTSADQLAKAQAAQVAKMQAFSKAADGVGKFAGSLGKGETNIAQFNHALDLASHTLGGVLNSFSKKFTLTAGITNAAQQKLTESFKYLVTEVDKFNQTFKELGKVGALTGGGFGEMLANLNSSNLSLSGFQKNIVENSVTLARYKGIVGAGAKEFSAFVGELANPNLTIGDPLRMLGQGADDIGETAIAFLTQQTRLGRSQADSIETLKKGTIDYAFELDAVAKLTGESKKTLMAQRDAALSDDRFRARLALINDKEIENRLLMVDNLANTFGPSVGQGVRDLIAAQGAAVTDAAKEVVNSIPGIQKALFDVQNKRIDEQGVYKAIVEGFKSTNPSRAQNASVQGQISGRFSPFAKVQDGLNRATADLNVVMAEARRQAEGTGDKTGIGKKLIDTEKNLEKMSREMRDGIILAMPGTAKAIETFSGYISDTTTEFVKLIKVLGDEGVTGAFKHLLNEQKNDAVSGTKNFVSKVFTDIGLWQSDDTNKKSKSTPAQPPSQNTPSGKGASESFDSSATTGASLSGLNDNFKDTVLAAANDYKASTGKSFQINSGLRTAAEQKKLWEAYQNGTGPRAAPPGQSRHERGFAVDIQNYNDPAAVAAMNKHGLHNPYGDDKPHFQQAANGGILSGPKSGYMANLHGTEAVVPLPDGRSIPITNTNKDETLELMAAQLASLEELVTTMKNQVNISKQMLQYAS